MSFITSDEISMMNIQKTPASIRSDRDLKITIYSRLFFEVFFRRKRFRDRCRLVVSGLTSALSPRSLNHHQRNSSLSTDN